MNFIFPQDFNDSFKLKSVAFEIKKLDSTIDDVKIISPRISSPFFTLLARLNFDGAMVYFSFFIFKEIEDYESVILAIDTAKSEYEEFINDIDCDIDEFIQANIENRYSFENNSDGLIDLGIVGNIETEVAGILSKEKPLIEYIKVSNEINLEEM